MKYILEVWYDESQETPNKTYEFDSLEETRKFAQELVTADEERGLDYAYFIVDSEDSDTWYDIWKE